MKASRKLPRSYSRHGLNALMGRVKVAGFKAIDGRSVAGRALMAWRSDLMADLGGPEAVSTQEAGLIDAATTTKLLLDHADSWLLGGPGRLINARRRSLYPILLQRQSLADALLRHLTALGLKRRAAPIPKPSGLPERALRGRARPRGRPGRGRRRCPDTRQGGSPRWSLTSGAKAELKELEAALGRLEQRMAAWRRDRERAELTGRGKARERAQAPPGSAPSPEREAAVEPHLSTRH